MNSVYQPDNVFPKRRTMRNKAYYITRPAMLDAIRRAGMFAAMGRDLPRDESAEECDVLVETGQDVSFPIIKLTVRVMASGVANRIQAKCPECGRWMRFCGLQQHVGTMTCRKAAGGV